MKRGLVVLDPAEVPQQERAERISQLQARMAEDGVSIALVYGDVHRSDDIGYLTNLCIYWNEGVLAVPAESEPVLLTKLSPRVHTWMRRTSTLTDLRSGPGFGALVRALVEDSTPGVLGLVDAALWPAAVAEEVRAAAPGWEVRPLGGLVRGQRLAPSPAEFALLSAAEAILRESLDAASAPGLPHGERVAVLEKALRGAGYTDVLAEVVHGPDGVSAVEAAGQYRFGWLHGARLVGEPDVAWAAGLGAALQAARAAVADGVPASVPVSAAEQLLTGLPPGATGRATCVHQADLSTGGDYADSAEELRSGAVVVLGVEVLFADGGRVVVADTVRVTANGAESLTGQEAAV